VTSYGSCQNQRFGVKHCVLHQCGKNKQQGTLTVADSYCDQHRVTRKCMQVKIKVHLENTRMGADDGAQGIECLGFWTSSIVQNSKHLQTQRSGNWISFCPQLRGREDIFCWVPKEELTTIFWITQQSRYLTPLTLRR
jgi:hypothetical protein